MGEQNDDWLVVGRITSVIGLQGWVKVYSYTSPKENLFHYPSWHLLDEGGGRRLIQCSEWRRQGKALVAKINGCLDRDTAQQICGFDIVVKVEELPNLSEGDYYWHQLEGLDVICDYNEKHDLLLGKVSHLLETGANDVLVVKATEQSIDKKERLIPYLPEQGVIKLVDLKNRVIRVSWDPEF